MSADNYLAVRKHKDKWRVVQGNASTGHEYKESEHESRDEAIDAASELMDEEYIEYGITEIER